MAYTKVLNDLTDEEWLSHKLPPVTQVIPSANTQLSCLDLPSYQPLPSGREVGTLNVVVEMENVTARLNDVSDVGDRECLSLLGIPGNTEYQCHPQCYAGIGGELVCLFGDVSDDDCDDVHVQEDVHGVPSPVVELSLTNTPASENISWCSQGAVWSSSTPIW